MADATVVLGYNGCMKLHRFYTPNLHNRFGPTPLGEEIWVHDAALLNQWLKVLRIRPGYELVLFNGQEDRLYRVDKINGSDEVKLVLVTTVTQNIPSRHVYLLWSVLKNDKNDWVLQKSTELGVRTFIPIISERSEKKELNIERAQKIIIEAAEQCGRSDIPEVREPVPLIEALSEHANDIPIYICEQYGSGDVVPNELSTLGILIGPEGGWSEQEKVLFNNRGLPHIALSPFTLRAETAAIIAASQLLTKGL